jgi:hypothetical protein
MAYDIIGDVHGQDGKLKALLGKLGYRIKDGAYRHPDGHMALFLGDLIDRGPGQIEVVNIVRDMIEAGSGRTIMGNHEWNAIGFATARPDGKGFLRNRSPNRFAQHEAFLRQIGLESALHKELVGWFKTLPPFLDLGAIRLCHAWWNPEFIAMIGKHSRPDGALDESFLVPAFEKGSPSWVAMEGVTKGLEVRLPEGSSFRDHTDAWSARKFGSVGGMKRPPPTARPPWCPRNTGRVSRRCRCPTISAWATRTGFPPSWATIG